ncbi:MAG: response regulator [Lachnospiraceae bacterium]|nr:response regulator [Lachnospiraceae bacterium]
MYKVLIVEDEVLFRRILTKIIESMEDYVVIGQLGDGESVMEFCEKEQPDFICMDILLPGENGLYVSQKVKKKYPSIVIFILSAYHDFQLIQTAMKSGLDAYLTKPYNAEEICRTFHKYQVLFEKDNYEKKLITNSINQRQLIATFDMCKKLVSDIFQIYEKEQDRYLQLKKITEYCVDYMGTLSPGNGSYYEQKYELAAEAERYSCVAEAFLHLLIQEIYRFQMLSKYPQFNTILSHIHRNLDKEITLNGISDLCNMSQGYITRIFKRYYGIGPVDYAHLIKIIWAKLYLACTELSISDISYNMGYNDPGYFGKVFKKYEGITPSQYKKTNCCQGYNITGGFGRLEK